MKIKEAKRLARIKAQHNNISYVVYYTLYRSWCFILKHNYDIMALRDWDICFAVGVRPKPTKLFGVLYTRVAIVYPIRNSK